LIAKKAFLPPHSEAAVFQGHKFKLRSIVPEHIDMFAVVKSGRKKNLAAKLFF
jgi:hypothetical protein